MKKHRKRLCFTAFIFMCVFILTSCLGLDGNTGSISEKIDEKICYSSDGTITSSSKYRHKYYYIEDNLRLDETSLVNEDGTYTVTQETEYEYDTNDNVTKKTVTYFTLDENDKLKLSLYDGYVYTYDEHESLILTKHTKEEYTDGVLKSSILYTNGNQLTYDTNGNIITSTLYWSTDDEAYQYGSLKEYTYDDENHLISEKENDTEDTYRITEYTYSDGVVVKELTSNSTASGELQPFQETDYFYDSDNYLILEKEYSYSDGLHKWLDEKTDYTVSENGNILTETNISYNYRTTTISSSSKDEYVYDRYNHVISQKHYSGYDENYLAYEFIYSYEYVS